MTDDDTVTVNISGWTSIPLSTSTEVEAIYDEDGNLDRTATLLQVDDEGNHLFDELDRMDTDDILAHLGADIEVTGVEISHE